MTTMAIAIGDVAREVAPALGRGVDGGTIGEVGHAGSAPSSARALTGSGSGAGSAGGGRGPVRRSGTGAEVGSVGRRCRPGKAARRVPTAMTSPPIQSHITSGWLVTRRVTAVDPFAGSCSRLSATSVRGVDATAGLPTAAWVAAVGGDAGLVGPGAVDVHPRRDDGLVGADVGHQVLEHDRVAVEVRGLARSHRQLGLAHVGGARRERDGDQDDADVDDHAAVGPTDQAPPPLAAGGQHQLADGRARREAGESEGDEWGEAALAGDDRDRRRSPSRSTPATAAGGAAARRWPCATAAPGRPP